MKPGPDFIIVGAMKCATSTLHAQLGRQPGCFMTQPKEPCFFSDDDQYERGVEWYQSLFRSAPPDALCGESSTHYTKLPTYPDTVDRMRACLSQVKLVYVMRHPVDRLESHYIHEWSQGTIHVPLDEAVEKHRELVEYGRYAMQLRPFLETFGPEAVLPVFFEQQVAHAQATLERICEFIRYPDRPVWDDALNHQNASRERMRQSRVRDILVETPVFRSLRRRLVPRSIRNRIKQLWTMNVRPELSPERRAQLEAEFDADLALLGGWLERDLSCSHFAGLPDEPAPRWRTGALEFSI